MKHLKRQDGFTLVELVVGIACATMVMAAAAALLLMGARIQRTLRDEAKEQQTVRIVLTMLEDLASEGGFDRVITTETGWELQNKAGTTVIAYENGSLSGAGENNVLLDGLKVAHAELNGQLLTFTFETDQNSYESSVYCRLIPQAGNTGDISPVKGAIESGDISKVEGLTGDETARYAFLQTLCAEYGSTGAIQNGDNAGTYYSEWYIGDYESNPGWNSSTPWCACFLSWAAQNISNAPRFANVDTGIAWFQTNNKFLSKGSTPTPGDYIFFDWEANNTSDPDYNDPDHVGVVLYVHDNMIYTIEGNSGSRVAIRSYLSTDKRIMGYGVLPWQST